MVTRAPTWLLGILREIGRYAVERDLNVNRPHCQDLSWRQPPSQHEHELSHVSAVTCFNNGLLFSLSLMMLSRRTEKKKEFLLSSSWILPRLSHSSLDAVMRWNYETLASAILRVCLHTAHTDVLVSCHLILIGQLQRQKYSTSRLTEIRWEIRCGKGEMRGGQIRWGKKRWGVDGVMI